MSDHKGRVWRTNWIAPWSWEVRRPGGKVIAAGHEFNQATALAECQRATHAARDWAMYGRCKP